MKGSLEISSSWGGMEVVGATSWFFVASSNKVGRFLLCFMLSLEKKSFFLVFPEGRDGLRGWKTPISKLRE